MSLCLILFPNLRLRYSKTQFPPQMHMPLHLIRSNNGGIRYDATKPAREPSQGRLWSNLAPEARRHKRHAVAAAAFYRANSFANSGDFPAGLSLAEPWASDRFAGYFKLPSFSVFQSFAKLSLILDAWIRVFQQKSEKRKFTQGKFAKYICTRIGALSTQ